MSDSKIVASARHSASQPRVADAGPGWAAMGWIGLTFLVVGASDFALVWYPVSFGTREWEFATVTQSFNGLPILLLGIGLLMVASEHVERSWWMSVGAGAAGVLLVWVTAGAVLWVSNVGLALETVPDELRGGIVKAVTKTAIQSVAYPAVLAYLLWRAWRGRRSRVAAEARGA